MGLAGVAATHDYFLLVNASWLNELFPQWVGERHFILTYGVIPVLLGILVNRFVDTLTELESNNESLDRRVTQRENELKDTYQRLLNLEADRRVTEERDRITQDMHDGMGALLFSTLAQVQRGHLQHGEIAGALEQCIAEMRLSIDSLSMTDQDAASLIGDFRYRWEPELRRLGLVSEWVLDIPDDDTGHPVEHVVQTLKVVQEALTNVIKHAKANRVQVTISIDATHVSAEVRDNGVGLPAQLRQGARGLANMLKRAQRMGGTFEILPVTPSGTRAVLLIPSTT
jgi:signal transduction histidine kinase